MSSAVHQAANMRPPRRGECLAIELDATTRAYRLTTLALAGFTPNEANTHQSHVFVTLQAEGADAYYYFADGTYATVAADVDDVDETAEVAAAGTLSFANTYAARIPANGEASHRLDRAQDVFLVVKGSAAGTLRLWASSEAF